MLNNRQEATKIFQQSHQKSIQRSLEHRLQVAKAKGDESLIRQLEAETKYFS